MSNLKTVAVVDYGSGNLRSVSQAVRHVAEGSGYGVVVTSSAQEVLDADRVVLPVLSPSGGVLFWQARAVDKRQPKYLAPPIDKATVIAAYGCADTVTLTEDLLSAYKVGKVGEDGIESECEMTSDVFQENVSRSNLANGTANSWP